LFSSNIGKERSVSPTRLFSYLLYWCISLRISLGRVRLD